MRDYSFGNFLRELRVRRGLSQFQLGMLVGVSDKAVSKWENGTAKPQSRILYKLGEVLGITVDELLACKYRSMENENIKGVFAMKKALWNKAGEALTSLYGDVPPMEVANRYYSEYAELKNSDQILYFEFLSRMAGLAQRIGNQSFKASLLLPGLPQSAVCRQCTLRVGASCEKMFLRQGDDKRWT